MKTVIITGSARGFGLAMLKDFRRYNYNTVIVDINSDALNRAEEELNKIKSQSKIIKVRADITREDDILNIIDKTLSITNSIDIWINNAGVNQPNCPIWKLDENTIDRLIDIDLKGTILCSSKILDVFIRQGYGQIFNVEGHGSNDATITGLSLYGTAKRGVTYFTEALAHEVGELGKNIYVGKITPGIMMTNFIHTSLGDGNKIEIDDKTKKVYNILGDYPETISKYMVDRIVKNNKNNVKFAWLTNRRAFVRFITYPFTKRCIIK